MKPAVIATVKKLDEIDEKLKYRYEIESLSITFRGATKLPEISVNFKKNDVVSDSLKLLEKNMLPHGSRASGQNA